jgi:hypothetical protein
MKKNTNSQAEFTSLLITINHKEIGDISTTLASFASSHLCSVFCTQLPVAWYD